MTTYHLHRSGVLRGLTNEHPPYCDPTKKNAPPSASDDLDCLKFYLPFGISLRGFSFSQMVLFLVP